MPLQPTGKLNRETAVILVLTSRNNEKAIINHEIYELVTAINGIVSFNE